MSKISELSDGGALQSTDYLIAVRSGGNVKVQLSELPSGIGAGGNIVFGDNEKAIFGAGSDLQIYHDASHSYIVDAGTGNMYLSTNGNGIVMQASLSETMFSALPNGSVRLYYDNAEKLSTTATGIDVTGTVTADGATLLGGVEPLTVKRSGTGTQASAIFIKDASDNAVRLESTNSNFTIQNTASNLDRLLVSNNGDVSLFEDTGTTPKFFWDASAERLGLGTTSPSYTLDVNTSDINAAQFTGTDASNRIQILLRSAGGVVTNIRGRIVAGYDAGGLGYGGYLALNTTSTANVNTEAMRIDSSGNVGIGTSSPGGPLEVTVASGTFGSSSGFRLISADGGGYSIYPTSAVANPVWNTNVNSNEQFSWSTGGNEKVRLDASGNLLVGTTAGSGASAPDNSSTAVDAGVRISGDGYIGIGNNTNPALYLNIIGADGAIQQFRKDGTTVGSIGTNSGDFYLGNGNTCLLFDDGSDLIRSANSSGGGRDGLTNLGNSSNRFKDLYLSGGVYLGGTVAANQLDDYEEGTWTPAFSFSTSGSVTYSDTTGTYTKVGRMVCVTCSLTVASISSPTGNVSITGLPFTSLPTGAIASAAIGGARNFVNSGLTLRVYNNPNTTSFVIATNDTDAGHAWLQGSNFTASTTLFITATYFV